METQEYFYKRWQEIHLSDQNNSSQVSDKAVSLRKMLNQIQAARATKLLDAESCNELSLREGDKYAELVDSPENEGGLNNYGEGVLVLLQGCKDESQQWKCSLSMNRVSQMDSVKQYKLLSKIAKGSVLPLGKDDNLIEISSETQAIETLVKVQNQEPLLKPATYVIERRSSRNQQGNNTTEHMLFSTSDDKPAKSIQNEKTNQGYTNFSMREPGSFPPHRKPEPVFKRSRDVLENEETENNFVTTGGAGMFKTARQLLAIDNQKKQGRNQGSQGNMSSAYGSSKKSLGTRRGINSKFVPPVINRDDGDDDSGALVRKAGPNKAPLYGDSEEETDERLKNIDAKMVELIMSEIMDQGQPLTWKDIAGLEFAKKTIQEIVVWPMLRPDIFTGLRGPPKGLLLFGPPGTGKTLIGKCIASQSKSTFFSISASSLTSKWVGEGEKMVRALFAVSRVHQPAVVFIDEIDSLLSQRSDSEHESSRRIKTEFLVQLDGATTGEADRVLVIGATNRPQEIDEAARRRFVKRLYIPLPECQARKQIIKNLMTQQKHHLEEQEVSDIVEKSQGYSGADMANLCREAALGPIRSIPLSDIENITAEQVRPILHQDFEDAFKQVRASVSDKDLNLYLEWNKQYGSFGM